MCTNGSSFHQQSPQTHRTLWVVYSVQFPLLSHENSSPFIASGVHNQFKFCIIYIFYIVFLSLKLFACCYAAAQSTDRLCWVIFTDWTQYNIPLTSLLSKSKVIKQPMQHEAQQKWHQCSFMSTPHHVLFETWDHEFEHSRNEQKRIRTDMRSMLLIKPENITDLRGIGDSWQ